jgi:hypothetical protein
MPTSFWRWFFAVSAVAIGLCVILQHVHYTVDVVAAFFFAFGAMKIGESIIKGRV